MSGPSVFILAVEPSADELGADLALNLRQVDPQISVLGIGGPAMERLGVAVDFDISELAIMGYVEVLKAYFTIRRKINEAISVIMSEDPQVVVLIDSWGFMIRVAKGLKQRGYQGKIIKYVAPQVWAMRAGRAKTLAAHVDHLLSIQPMDHPFFEAVGLDQTFVGNPMFDERFSPNHTSDEIEDLSLEDKTLILVLFGSREAEVRSLFQPFMEALIRLDAEIDDAVFSTIIPDNVVRLTRSLLAQHPFGQKIEIIDERSKKVVFARANVALACSGTVTTQLAMSGTPSVVAYKLNPLTFSLGRFFFKPDHISLVNISANDRVIPEFLQGEVTAENLSRALSSFLKDTELSEQTSKKLLHQTALMQGKGGSASKRAASAILNLVGAL